MSKENGVEKIIESHIKRVQGLGIGICDRDWGLDDPAEGEPYEATEVCPLGACLVGRAAGTSVAYDLEEILGKGLDWQVGFTDGVDGYAKSRLGKNAEPMIEYP